MFFNKSSLLVGRGRNWFWLLYFCSNLQQIVPEGMKGNYREIAEEHLGSVLCKKTGVSPPTCLKMSCPMLGPLRITISRLRLHTVWHL